MAQAQASQCPAPSATFNEDIYHTFLLRMEERLAMIGILGGLYGVLTILSVLSAYALIRGMIQPTAVILCIILLVLVTSTTIHLVTSILSWRADFATSIMLSAPLLWSYNQSVNFQSPGGRMVDASSAQFHGCCVTAALITNVILGDAIVCWRACVVWQNSRVVWAVCTVFLLATFIPGVINTMLSCNPDLPLSQSHFGVPIAGATYTGFPAGIAASVLSLAANFLATFLVGCKAWESRKRLRVYFVGGPVASQVEKLFALLIESGAIYCALWAFVVAFELVNESSGPHPTRAADAFAQIGVFLEAAVVPLIAIYPTIIIVFVALRRSHIERALTRHQSVPTPRLSLALGSIVESRSAEGVASPMSGMGGQDVVIGLADGLGDANARTDEERRSKIGGLI